MFYVTQYSRTINNGSLWEIITVFFNLFVYLSNSNYWFSMGKAAKAQVLTLPIAFSEYSHECWMARVFNSLPWEIITFLLLIPLTQPYKLPIKKENGLARDVVTMFFLL